jgi:hypothetical protein
VVAAATVSADAGALVEGIVGAGGLVEPGAAGTAVLAVCVAVAATEGAGDSLVSRSAANRPPASTAISASVNTNARQG